MNQPENTDLPSKPHVTRGIEKLTNFYLTGQGLSLDQNIYQNPQDLSPIIRGVQTPTQTSITELLELSPVIDWIADDPAGFIKTTERDRKLHFSLEAIAELTDSLQDPEKSVTSDTLSLERVIALRTLSVTEQLAQAVALALPFVPRVRAGMLVEVSGQSKWPAFYKSSFLLTDSRAGELRPDTEPDSTQEMLKMNQEAARIFGNGTFILSKLNNRYDPRSGSLKSEFDKAKAFYSQFGSGALIEVPLEAFDPSKIKEIGLPRPIPDATRFRYRKFTSPRDYDSSLSGVQIFQNGGILGDDIQTTSFIKGDEAGNYSLMLDLMPDEIKTNLSSGSAVIVSDYTTERSKAQPIDPKNLIGPLSETERQQDLSLFPKKIADLIRVMKTKQQSGDPHFSNNLQIFSRLTQFLATYWLTYSYADAPRSPQDPVGFNQIERVLESRWASCEGSGLALGQLMRHFLKDGEGIAFAEGFVMDEYNLDGSISAKPKDYHMKVFYQDQKGEQHYFDPTPWSQEDHKTFRSAGRKYNYAKKEWIERFKKMKAAGLDTKDSAEKSADALNGLYNSWVDYPSYSHDAKDKLDLYRMVYRAKPQSGGATIFSYDDLHTIISDDAVAMTVRYDSSDPTNQRQQFIGADTGMDTVNLWEFLKYQAEVRDGYSGLWVNSYNPLSALTEFKLRRLENPMYLDYRNNPIQVRDYTEPQFDRLTKKYLLNFPTFREGTYRQIEIATLQAVHASYQNVEAVNQLSDNIRQLGLHFDQVIKALFQPYQHLMGGDIETFISSVPFRLFFPNPLNYLRSFFTRSIDTDKMGQFVSSDPDTIKRSFDTRMDKWHQDVLPVIEQLKEKLAKAPLSKKRSVNKQEVSSTFLWEADGQQTDTSVEENDQPLCLDPIDVFNFLDAPEIELEEPNKQNSFHHESGSYRYFSNYIQDVSENIRNQ